VFRGLIVVQDELAGAALSQLAAESRLVEVARVVNNIPKPYELAQLLNVADPEIVFLQTDATSGDWKAAAAEIRELRPHAALLGVQTSARGDWGSEGFPTIGVPYNLREFTELAEGAIRAARPAPRGNLWAILPAKAGSGASTVTVQTAACLKRSFGNQVLVIEADLHSGIFADILGVPVAVPLREVLSRASNLEEREFRRMVTTAHGVDFLLTDRKKETPLPNWCEWLPLLELAQSLYDVVLVDLPEVVNDGTAEVVRRAKRVWIVLTAELPSISLATQRGEELASRGVSPEKVELIVNRWHRTDAEPPMIEEMIGSTVAAVIKNDYKTLKEAMLNGRLVDASSELGLGYLELARRISQTPEIAPVAAERPGLFDRLRIRRG
jgi:pilus assembly protein CpaE